MIGFHDYITNSRSGRPEPHGSWQAERFVTWTGWTMSAISVVGAIVYYAKWEILDGAAQMSGAGLLFAIIAIVRGRALGRKRKALLVATNAYEQMLYRAFR